MRSLILLSSSLINNIWTPWIRHRHRHRHRPLTVRLVVVTFVFTAVVAILDGWVTIFLTVNMMNPSKALVVVGRRRPFFLHVEAWLPSPHTAVSTAAVSRRSIGSCTNNNNSLRLLRVVLRPGDKAMSLEKQSMEGRRKKFVETARIVVIITHVVAIWGVSFFDRVISNARPSNGSVMRI